MSTAASTPPALSVLVTRPGAKGEALAQALQADGFATLWLPAFDLAAAPDAVAARQTLQRLHEFDLAVFVSPAAVRATAELLTSPWPTSTKVGAVGSGTRLMLEQVLASVKSSAVIAPADEQAGSEAFLNALTQHAFKPRKVLILRAAQGRELLSESLRAQGAQVEALAVYQRNPHRLSEPEQAHLIALSKQHEAGVIVCTSSEAVGSLLSQTQSLPQVQAWLKQSYAWAPHPRILQALQAVGFTRTQQVAADYPAVKQAIIELLDNPASQ